MATPLQQLSPKANGASSHSSQLARQPNSFKGCSRITDYDILGKLGEGTFGEVHRARSKKTGAVVALKKILMHNEKDGFPITALREIKLLKLLSHPNILKLEEMAIEHAKSNDKRKRAIVYMVTPYMDHDLSGLLENPNVRFTEPQIKCYMLQLLEGLRYLHDQRILHRDMKAANLLINNRGVLQIADFGLARHYDEAPPVAGHGGGEAKRDYTPLVVTRWYRPPELLLGLKRYTTAIDLWGVGCVFGEMFIGKPILTGESDLDQLKLICNLVGSPTDETMPGWQSLPGAESMQFPLRPSTIATRFKEHGSEGAILLLADLLRLDWRKRLNAIDALQHSYFKTAPLPARPGDIPTFEDSHELDRRKFRGQKPALPPAPKGGDVGMGPQQHAGWGGEVNYLNGNDAYNNHSRSHQNGNRRPHYYNQNHDYRNGGPPPAPTAEERRPAWQIPQHGQQSGQRHPPPPPPPPRRDYPDTTLPPRPPKPANDRGYRPPNPVDGAVDRDYRPRSREPDRSDHRGPSRSRAGGGGGGGGGNVDTYIPSYRSTDAAPRRNGPNDSRPFARGRREDWDSHRDRDGHRNDKLDYDERSRSSRTRSTSPRRDLERGSVRDREPLDRETERERERDYRW